MAGTSKVREAYEFLFKKAGEESTFSVDDVCRLTGWKPETVKTYLSKHWSHFTEKLGRDNYRVLREFRDYPLDVFLRISSQKFLVNKDPFKPLLSQRTEELVNKSRESALLAVQVYNNPLLGFRTPSFVVHMIIAFTSLFHAIFEEDGIDYSYKRQEETKPERFWDISECIRRYWKDENGPVRKNLELFVTLRDMVEHRYAPVFDCSIAGECQALLFNYEKLLVEEFSPYYSLGVQVAVPLQLSKASSPAKMTALRELQKSDYRFLSEVVRAHQAALSDDIIGSMDYSFSVYLIPKPANKASASDVSMEFVRLDERSKPIVEELQRAITLVRTIPVANHGLLRAIDVVRIIQETTEPRFRMHEHTSAWKLFKVRPREKKPEGCDTQFCQFDVAHKDFVYTNRWVERLKKAVKDEQTYEKIREYRDPSRHSA